MTGRERKTAGSHCPKARGELRHAAQHDPEEFPMTAPPDRPDKQTGRPWLFLKRHEMTIARAEVVIIFLALTRTLTAYYQLQTRPGDLIPAGQAEPIITGSLVAALFCLALTLLSFLGRHRVMHVVFALAITSLALVKAFLFTG